MSKLRATVLDSLDRRFDPEYIPVNLLKATIWRYALAVTTGSIPSGTLDTSFMDNLGLQGYVPASSRGTVSGSYSGTLSGQPVTIAFNVKTF